MRVSLIQCPAWLTYSPPIGLAILSNSITKEGHIVKCYDLNIKTFNYSKNNNHDYCNSNIWDSSKIDKFWCDFSKVEKWYNANLSLLDAFILSLKDFNPEIIGLSVQYSSLHFSHLLSKQLKELFPKSLIAWGGPYCYNNYGNLNHIIYDIPEIDIICTGDGEKNFHFLLSYYEKHGEFPIEEGYYIRSKQLKTEVSVIGNLISPLSLTPLADYSFFNISDYTWEFIPILVSRGCIKRCSFCNESLMHKKYSFRNPDAIIEEIKYQLLLNSDSKSFYFAASNIGGNYGELKKLCKKIKESNLSISWSSLISINPQLTVEMFRLMCNSGCKLLSFGVESGSNKVLKLMQKGYDSKLVVKTLHNAEKAGIRFNFNIITGFPGETITDFIKTLLFIHRFQRYEITPSISSCVILPNSRIFNFPNKYKISNFKSKKWAVNDGRNTFEIRKVRKQIAEFVYHSRILNLINLPKRTFRLQRRIPVDKGSRKNILLKKIFILLSIILQFITYIPFVLWVIIIIVKLKYLEIIERKIYKNEQTLINDKITLMKEKIISDLKKHIANNQNSDELSIDGTIQLERLNELIELISENEEKLNLLNNAASISVSQLFIELSEYTSQELYMRIK